MSLQGADEARVRAINLAFYRAFEAGDLDAMARVWAETLPVSCLHPGWEPIVGREAVLEAWAGIFRGTRSVSFTLRQVRVLLANDAAWVVLVEEIELQNADGQRVHAATHTTNVFAREGGEFKMVHHHAGPAVALPPPGDAEGRVLH